MNSSKLKKDESKMHSRRTQARGGGENLQWMPWLWYHIGKAEERRTEKIDKSWKFLIRMKNEKVYDLITRIKKLTGSNIWNRAQIEILTFPYYFVPDLFRV